MPTAGNQIIFSIEGPGKIIATDNGNPADMTAFPSLTRKGFNGLALAVVQSFNNETGLIKVIAESPGLTKTEIFIDAVR